MGGADGSTAGNSAPAAGELEMYRRRGRTVGTFIIGASIVATVVYVAFGGLRSATMPSPYVIGAGFLLNNIGFRERDPGHERRYFPNLSVLLGGARFTPVGSIGALVPSGQLTHNQWHQVFPT